MADPPYALAGKRVVITGASSGLGAECAIAFANLGATVVMVARSQRRLQRLAQRISRSRVNPLAIAADVRRPADVSRIRTLVDGKLGGCDMLINNAGVYLGDCPVAETNLDDWTDVIDTNLRAPYLLCRCFIQGMLKRGYGRIINIISGTSDLERVGVFRISKIGLEVLTLVLAAELEGSGVAAAAFNPGWMKTKTSSSGRSPKGAARAITEMVQRQGELLNGSRIDLRWIGRRYQLRTRGTDRGRFGV